MIGRGALVAVRLADVFLRKHGHSRKNGPLPVNADGEFQPWLTYPMIEFLDGLDLAGKSVLEFGSGGSTLYFAKRAKDVVSVEMDSAWADRMDALAPPNARIIREPDGGKYPDAPKSLGGQFDVILIDGAERYRSAQTALLLLAAGGIVILDNAEWYPNCCELLGKSLIEMPFSGFGPINAFPSISTAFLCREFSMERLRRSPPIGGRALLALDDGP